MTSPLASRVSSSAIPAAAPSGRNPWPIALIGFFVIFISAVVSVGIFASRQNLDLVRPDYYEEEIRFQAQIDRVARTQALPTAAHVEWAPGTHQLALTVPTAKATGTVRLYRPSDAKMDREFPLNLNAQGQQEIALPGLPSGLWKVLIRWKTDAGEFAHEQPLVIPRS